MCLPYVQTRLDITLDAIALEPADRVDPHVTALRKALARYIDLTRLQQLAASGGNLQDALIISEGRAAPVEVQAILTLFAALLRPQPRQKITCPADVAGILMAEMGWLEHEQFRVVLLDTKQNLLSIELIYQGTVNSAPVRVAEVFKLAIRHNVTGMILVHNHPSSEISPSPEDVTVTREIVSAGRMLGIEVLDHLIVGRGNWTSLRERRIGFSR